MYKEILQLQNQSYKMQKTKPISKTHVRNNHKNHERSIHDDFNFTISPLLHESVLLTILNYQSQKTQSQPHFSMEDFVRNIQEQHYCYYQSQTGLNKEQTFNKKMQSLELINAQYTRKMQETDVPQPTSAVRVTFNIEATAKYFKSDDSPHQINNYEEYSFPLTDQNDSLYRYNL